MEQVFNAVQKQAKKTKKEKRQVKFDASAFRMNNDTSDSDTSYLKRDSSTLDTNEIEYETLYNIMDKSKVTKRLKQAITTETIAEIKNDRGGCHLVRHWVQHLVNHLEMHWNCH